MRIAYDATAAATQTAGVGRYARELLRELVTLDPTDDFQLICAASDADGGRLLQQLPPGAARGLRRLPGGYRATTIAWQRLRLPIAIERLTGPFDVFHATDFVAPPSSRPIVTTVHDLSYLNVPHLGDERLVRYLSVAVPRTLARSERIIAVSATVAAEIAAEYPETRNRIVAIPNGVRLPAAQQSSSPADRPTVLMVGTVEPRKNHLAALEAMRLVRDRESDAELVIVGRPGWRSDGIIEAIRAAEAEGWVRWLVSADDAELAAAYGAASLFLYPSWYEGFGLPVLEAMSFGVPVVAGDIPALREAADDAAWFANPADPAEIADRITTLLDGPAARDDLRTRGLARAGRYSWRDTAERTRRTYAQAKADAR